MVRLDGLRPMPRLNEKSDCFLAVSDCHKARQKGSALVHSTPHSPILTRPGHSVSNPTMSPVLA